MINIVYTICQERFAEWVKERVEERNQKVAVDKGLMLDVDEEIANALVAAINSAIELFLGMIIRYLLLLNILNKLNNVFYSLYKMNI